VSKPVVRWIAAIAVATSVLVIGANVLFAGAAIPGIGDHQVADVTDGRQFLLQEIDLALPDRPSPVTGQFEYLRVPGRLVVEFQAQLNVVEPAWVNDPPQSAVVLSWSSQDVTFQVPRPRPGVEAKLAGDTFVIILVPGEGRKITAIVASDALAAMRRAGQDVAHESLTLAATK
jgi:hypothetical protein